MYRNKKIQQGFSLIEVLFVFVLGTLLLGSALTIGAQYYKLHRQEINRSEVEANLGNTEESLQATLTSLAGRNLGYLNLSYRTPIMPIITANGEKMKLDMLTPCQVNGYDAFMVITTTSDSPRLELSQAYTLGSGVAKVALPKQASIHGNQSSNPSSPDFSSFQIGQLMMLIGAPDSTTRDYQPQARMVKLLEKPSMVEVGFIRNNLKQPEAQFIVDECASASCVPFSNDNITYTNFAPGSVLMPMVAVSYYVKSVSGQNYLVRNEGGFLIPQNNQFVSFGGTETLVSEVDKLSISYQLNDGTNQPTPASPNNVSWLKQIQSVSIFVSRTLPASYGKEPVHREETLSFPIHNLELD